MSDLDEMMLRLSKLERSNRTMQVSGTILVLLLGAVILMGAAPSVPAVIEAQRFVLKDAGGHERGSLFALDKSWGLVLYNRDSSKAAALAVADTGNTVMLADHKGNTRDAMFVSEEESTFAIWDAKTNKMKIELKNTADGSSVALRDDNGTDRLGLVFAPSIGAGMTINDANSTTRTAVIENQPGIALYGADGAMEWAAGIDSLSKDEQQHVRDALKQLDKKKK